MRFFDKKEEVQPIELEPAEFKKNIEIVKDDYERIAQECEGKIIDVEKSWNDKLDEIEARWKAEYDKVVKEEPERTEKVRQAMVEMQTKYAQYEDWLKKAPAAYVAQREYIKQQCKVEFEAAQRQKEIAVVGVRQEYQDRLDSRKPLIDKMQKVAPK